MTRHAARAAGATPGRDQVNLGSGTIRHRRGGLLRRGRQGSGAPSSAAGRVCPDCGLPTQDPVAARLGFCARCQDFTGMCGAGRRVICPDMMTMTSWHTPCTNLGAVAWQISLGAGPRVTLLCPEHDAEIRIGSTSWIGRAVPLADLNP